MQNELQSLVIIRGGGDLASGVALRLYRAGFSIAITELPRPLTVRRTVSFSEAVYSRSIQIEGIVGELVSNVEAVSDKVKEGKVAIVIDPDFKLPQVLPHRAIVDARMKKTDCGIYPQSEFVIGLGPGFEAGVNCSAVVETMRGPFLGRVYWHGMAAADTGVPDTVAGHQADRVLRATDDGIMIAYSQIGDKVYKNQIIASINDSNIIAPFDGVLRGLIHNGIQVSKGMKVGDVDPRDIPDLCYYVSDKALGVGGGVLEAILTPSHLRK